MTARRGLGVHTTTMTTLRPRRLAAAITLLAVLLTGRFVRADERDNAVVGRMTLLNRKAIEQYQALNFDEAQKLLREALDLAESSGLLQHPLRARTYVTLGIVTLGGLKQRDEAIKLFRRALQIQPEIKLSRGLANPEIQAAFDEAVEGLSREPKPGDIASLLPPEKLLAHDPLRTSHRRSPISVVVSPDRSLNAAAVILAYRPASSSVFVEETMVLRPSGIYEGEIPAAATDGSELAYYLEGRDARGRVLVTRGSAATPFVVALSGSVGEVADSRPPPESITTPGDAGAARSQGKIRRLVLALSVGTGFGSISGTAEETQEPVSGGVHWASAAHIAPMIGYFVTPQLLLGVQARLQIVSGANEYHLGADAAAHECGDEHVCSAATGAIAGFLKAAWYFT